MDPDQIASSDVNRRGKSPISELESLGLSLAFVESSEVKLNGAYQTNAIKLLSIGLLRQSICCV